MLCHYAGCHILLTIMLNVINAECHYAECHYAECHYDNCHSTFFTTQASNERKKIIQNVYLNSFIQPKMTLKIVIKKTIIKKIVLLNLMAQCHSA